MASETADRVKSFTSPEAMMQWQYREIIFELGEISRHAGDPNCPCVLANKGEYCIPKHSLAVHGLCRETAAMETNTDRIALLEQLQEEAYHKHIALKDRIVCKNVHDDEGDVIDWSRQWRKKFEDIYYHSSCSVDLHKNTASSPKWCPRVKTVEKDLSKLSNTLNTARKRILTNYADSVIKLPPPQQGSLLPIPTPTKEELWAKALEADEAGPQPAMFHSNVLEKAITICEGANGKLIVGSQATGTEDQVSLVTACPAGAKVVGVWHRHPGEFMPEPSEADIHETEELHRRTGGTICITGAPEVELHRKPSLCTGLARSMKEELKAAEVYEKRPSPFAVCQSSVGCRAKRK